MKTPVTASLYRPSARVHPLTMIAFVGAGLLALASLILAFTPVGGSTEGESFQCGSPFAYADSGNYAGTSGFTACDDRRHERAAVAITGLAVGVGVAAGAGMWTHRSRRAESSSP